MYNDYQLNRKITKNNNILHIMTFKKPEDQWSCKRSPDIFALESTKPGKYMVKK